MQNVDQEPSWNVLPGVIWLASTINFIFFFIAELFYICSKINLIISLFSGPCNIVTLDHFLSEKVMVFDNFLAADKHK